MAPRPFIIDCDPGQDDAIALLIALASPEDLHVLGVTCVAGNAPLTRTQINARRVCVLANRADLPVFAGCTGPLLRALATAQKVHGESGLDGSGLPEERLRCAAKVASVVATREDNEMGIAVP